METKIESTHATVCVRQVFYVRVQRIRSVRLHQAFHSSHEHSRIFPFIFRNFLSFVFISCINSVSTLQSRRLLMASHLLDVEWELTASFFAKTIRHKRA